MLRTCVVLEMGPTAGVDNYKEKSNLLTSFKKQFSNLSGMSSWEVTATSLNDHGSH